MTELTDLNDTDALNTTVTGQSTEGNVANMGGMDDLFQATLGMLSRFRNANIFRLRDNTDKTKLLAFDLSGLTTATTRTFVAPNRSGTLSLTTDIDTRRNRIVNGDMRVSQENGTTAGNTNGYYGADQWAQYRVTSAGTVTVGQVASVTPAGSPNRLRATVVVADASLAAGEYWTLSQNLEGSNVADFRYGSASAKNAVLRFGFKGPAGTYAVALHNSAVNRSYVALFTIAAPDANTDTVQTISIAGDQSGTWLTADGVIGITLDIVLAAGSTFQGTTGWQSGNILATSAISNGMGTGSAVFELFDVGLRLDPDATGVYGAYEVGETDAVYRSERYGYKVASGVFFATGTVRAALTEGFIVYRIPDMCKPFTASWTTAPVAAVGSSNGTITSLTAGGYTSGAVGTVGYAVAITASAGGVFFSARLS